MMYEYLVIRNSIPFLFANKREAMEFIDSEDNSQISDSFSLWRISLIDGTIDPLSLNMVRYNLERGYHE